MLTNLSELRMAESFVAQLAQLLTDACCADPAETAEAQLARVLDALADLQTEYRLRLQLSRRLHAEELVSWECDEPSGAAHTPRPPRPRSTRCPGRTQHRAQQR